MRVCQFSDKLIGPISVLNLINRENKKNTERLMSEWLLSMLYIVTGTNWFSGLCNVWHCQSLQHKNSHSIPLYNKWNKTQFTGKLSVPTSESHNFVFYSFSRTACSICFTYQIYKSTGHVLVIFKQTCSDHSCKISCIVQRLHCTMSVNDAVLTNNMWGHIKYAGICTSYDQHAYFNTQF